MDIYYMLLFVLALPHNCEAFVFTSSPSVTTTACDGDTATFNWIYTSGTPTSIAWTRRNTDAATSLNASVASLSLGIFIPDAAYVSRVTQVGNAGINLSNITPSDDGIYQVEITDTISTLKGTTTLITVDIPMGTIRATYSNNAKKVTCDGLSSHGYGLLSLVQGGTTVTSTESLSLEYTPSKGGTFCCCVRMKGDSAKCLPAGESYTNCSALCVEVTAATTTSTQTPGPPTAGTSNKDYYLLFLIIIPIAIIIVIVVLVVKNRKKKKASEQKTFDMKHMKEEKRSSEKASTSPPGGS